MRVSILAILRSIALVIAAAAVAGEAGAATKFAVASGNWNAASGVWASGGGTSCASAANSGTPAAADTAIICGSVTVTLTSSPSIKNVTVNSTGILQDDGAASQTMTLSGDLTNNGTVDFQGTNPSTITLSGNSEWSGTGTTWNLGAIGVANKILSFGNAMTLNLSAASPITLTSGGVTDPAPTLITWNFNGTVAQTLPTALAVRYGRITINNTAGVTLGVGLNILNLSDNVLVQSGILKDGGFAIAGQAGKTFQIAAGATFQMTRATNGVSGFSTFDYGTTGACGTFDYAGTAQTVSATAPNYGNLMLSNSGVKTMPGTALTVACDFSMSGSASATSGNTMSVGQDFLLSGTSSFTAGAAVTVTRDMTLGSGTAFSAASFTHDIGRDFSNNGTTFTAGTSRFNFNGSAAQAIGGSSGTTFNNLTVANASGVTINTNTTVAGTAAGALTLTSGVLTTGSNILIASGNCNTATVTRTSGWVGGFLRKTIPTGAVTCSYEVGDASNYRPIGITFTSVATSGTVTGSVSQASGNHPNISTSLIDALKKVNRYWTLTNAGTVFNSGGNSYSVTLNFLAGDIDAAASTLTSLFEIESYNGATWAATTAGTANPTDTTATGLTAMSDLAVGRKKVKSFVLSVPGSGDTCTAASVTITAKDSRDITMTDYTGTMNLTTSTADGTWSTAATGTFTETTPDDGIASYGFVSADAGVVTLSLADIKINSDVTVNAVDSVASGSSTTSAAIPFRGNFFDIASATALNQVAGKDQAMSATRKRGASCNTILTEYALSKPLKAWYTADGSHPSGALAPSIAGLVGPPLGTSAPGSDNLTLTFTAGAASFSLTTTDVGKYQINLRDSAAGNVDGISGTITTRPFAVVASAIKQGITNNLGGTASAGSKFIAAADSFQATVGAYLWKDAADSNNDGLPDASATLAQITASGPAPAYRVSTMLSAASPYTPAVGTLGTLSNGTQSGACPAGAPNCFTSGVATPTNLSYNDVGSFTLTIAADFLGVDLAAEGRTLVFDNSATPLRSAVVGRFHPDHFTVTTSSITPFCSGFTYMGQSALGYDFNIEARNLSNVKTNNYGAGYTTGTVSQLAENNDNGTDLSSRLSAPSGSWSFGTFSSATTATFSRPASPDGPYDLLQIGVLVTDSDGPVLAGRDMNPSTAGACGGSCTGVSIGTTKARFARLRILPATGNAIIRLPATIRTEYWNGTGFLTNTLDSCTTLRQGNIAMGSYATSLTLNACETRVDDGTGGAPPADPGQTIAFASGLGTMVLTAPGSGNNGSLVLTVKLNSSSGTYCRIATATDTSISVTTANKSYLQGAWNGVATYDQDPQARFAFGVYGAQPNQLIFMRENY